MGSVAERFREIKKKLGFTSKSEVFVYLVCLFIATLFWFLTVLDKEYLTDIQVPLTYNNFPENKILSEPLPEEINVFVKAPGWDILGVKIGKETYSYSIDLERVQNTRKIVTDRDKKLFDGNLPSSFNAIDFFPDTILVKFEEVDQKPVPVKLNGNFSFARQHGLSGPIIVKPDLIDVTGPKSVIHKLEELKTQYFEYNDLEHTVNVKLPLIKQDNPFIRYSSEEVELMIPVDELTEGEVKLPIKIRDNKKNISLIPEYATVTYQTTLGNYDRIDSSDFRLIVEIPQKSEPERPSKVKVTIVQQPQYIYNVRVQPEFVDYLYKKDEKPK